MNYSGDDRYILMNKDKRIARLWICSSGASISEVPKYIVDRRRKEILNLV